MDAVHRPAFFKGFGDAEEPLVGGLPQLQLEILERVAVVADHAIDPDLEHAGGFLQGLFEAAADGHDLADGLHLRADFLGHAAELLEVPARDLDHQVIEGRLEAGRRPFGDGIEQAGQAVPQTQLGGDKGQRISGGLGGQGRAAGKPGVDLDDAVVAVLGMEGVLDIAFADDAQVADGLEGDLPQHVVFGVGQRLGRGDDDALARVDAHGVEVLHVADGDAVVVGVADDLVFDFLPAFQVFLDEDLGGRRESPLEGFLELGLVAR